MLHIVCRRNLGEYARHHLDNMFYGHAADLVLGTLIPALLSEALIVVRKGLGIVVGQALDVRQVFDFYMAGRWRGRIL